MEQVLVVGESLVDVVRRPGEAVRELPGGSAANAAVALARLGMGVSLVTALGRDPRGETLHDHLVAEGVTWGSDPFSLARTATAEAVIAADGSATYTFDIAWRLHEPRAADPPDAVLVSSLGPVLAPGSAQVLDLVTRLVRSSAVMYDVNARPSITGAGPDLLTAVRTMAAHADIVKASDEDLEVLMPGLGTHEAAGRLLEAGARAVVVTLGASGVVWVDRARTVRAASTPVRAVDTIGAGDTFGAALLTALGRAGVLHRRQEGADSPFDLSDQRLGGLLGWAGAAAAVTVSRAGADPPRLSELAPLEAPPVSPRD